MKITLAQLNPIVGDVSGNLQKVVDTLEQYGPETDLIVFSELFLVGYPPRDLLEQPALIEATQAAVEKLLAVSRNFPRTGMLVGAPMPTGQDTGKGLNNCALLICGGEILFRQNKSLLPTYDVFDETRHFAPAAQVEVFPFQGEKLGISICEDAWYDPELWSRCLYSLDPIQVLAEKGATLLINISSSPFQVGKEEVRFRLLNHHAQRFGLPVIYVNQVGGNDELIFDGRSLVLDGRGVPSLVLPAFREAVATADPSAPGQPGLYEPLEEIANVHAALVLGLRDYLHKCGFSRAVVGLSGGVDSAVTCCLAQQSLGKENVLGVLMPSPYSSRGSIRDSRKLAKNLGIPSREIPITPIYRAYLRSLKGHLEVEKLGVSLENVQARIRGNILMALSNEFGYLVLSTGNKSELAVGYCTLYGDMSGGLSVLADVPKTMVYQLARFLNREKTLIPEEIITKAPSAELRPGQKDQDTLPPYEILDQIMNCYLTEGYAYKDIIALGFDPQVVRWVIRAIDRSEYKRRQAAPGLKITSKAFGMGRRIPIAARYEF
ncbi:MAG: NAD+ synthase [Thermodesulfobacteriota bacterium]